MKRTEHEQMQHTTLNRVNVPCKNIKIILRIANVHPPRITNIGEIADEFWTAAFI